MLGMNYLTGFEYLAVPKESFALQIQGNHSKGRCPVTVLNIANASGHDSEESPSTSHPHKLLP
jgi:hypothetical protein